MGCLPASLGCAKKKISKNAKKKDAKSNNNGANGLALVEYAFAILGRKRGG